MLVALWITGVCLAVLGALEAISSPGAFVVVALIAAVLMPGVIALQLAWLWLIGCFWQKAGLPRMGTRWRDIAAVHFGAVRAVFGSG